MSDESHTTDDGTDAAAPSAESTEQGTHSAAPPDDPDGAARTDEAGHPDDRDPDSHRSDDGRGHRDGIALAVSLVFGFALAIGSVLLVSWLDPSFEGLLRVRPTVSGGGVGAGWVAGNADAALNLLIALVHLADVVMGVFILVMVFVHWAAFRRLAARMEPPGGRRSERGTAATDGGERGPRGGDSRPGGDAGERTRSGSDGGERG